MRAKRTSALGGLSPPLMSWSAEAASEYSRAQPATARSAHSGAGTTEEILFALRQGIVYCIGQAWTREHERWPRRTDSKLSSTWVEAYVDVPRR